jgi:hypothetical protein
MDSASARMILRFGQSYELVERETSDVLKVQVSSVVPSQANSLQRLILAFWDRGARLRVLGVVGLGKDACGEGEHY